MRSESDLYGFINDGNTDFIDGKNEVFFGRAERCHCGVSE